VNRVKTALQEYGVDSECLTVENLQRLLDRFRDDISIQLQEFRHGNQRANEEVERVENGTRYGVHFHSGGFKRVPADWRSHVVGFLTYGNSGGLGTKSGKFLHCGFWRLKT